MKGKRNKGFVVKVSGETFTCIEAKVILSDETSTISQWNHPKVWLQFRKGEDTRDWNKVAVVFEFQRESMAYSSYGSTPEPERAVYGRMDTTMRWTVSYGAHINIEDVDRVSLGDGELMLSAANKLRLRVNRLVGEAIVEYNLHRVSEDQCEQVAYALEKLGTFVEWEYIDVRSSSRDGTRTAVSLHEAHNMLRANEKHRKAEETRTRGEAMSDADREPKPETETTTN